MPEINTQSDHDHDDHSIIVENVEIRHWSFNQNLLVEKRWLLGFPLDNFYLAACWINDDKLIGLVGLIRKCMDVKEHERLSNITLWHKLK